MSDLFDLFVRPSDLFDSLPWNVRYAGALLFLLVVQGAIGWGEISTGVPDYEIDSATSHSVAEFLKRHEGEEDSADIVLQLDAIEKRGVFGKTLTRVVAVVGAPLGTLVGVGVIAGLLFVVSALTLGKPNYAVLVGVVIYAWWVYVPQWLLKLLLVSQLQASRVELSAAAFVQQPDLGIAVYILLRRLNPFDVWFWCLVALGLRKTGQTSSRTAWLACSALWLVFALYSCGIDLLQLGDFGWDQPPEPGEPR